MNTLPTSPHTPVVKITQNRETSTKSYKIGDYYDDGIKQGVVVYVDGSGRHGKIVSLAENRLTWAWGKYEIERLIGADDKNDGANNMAKVKMISDWRVKYPAFAWCAGLGEEWYLPAIEELKLFTPPHPNFDNINQTLEIYGTKIKQPFLRARLYWSSTEYGKFSMGAVGRYGVWTSRVNDIKNFPIQHKSLALFIRAVAVF